MANGEEFHGKGFGVEISAKGALVVIVVLVLALAISLGWLLLYIGDRIETQIRNSGSDIAVARQEILNLVMSALQQQGAAREKEYLSLASSLKIVACSAWYTPEERKAIRQKIEKEPALAGAWCP